jgi:hypothetical protein
VAGVAGRWCLWVSGLLPVVLNELDQITWKMGTSTLSVRTLLEGLLTASAVLIPHPVDFGGHRDAAVAIGNRRRVVPAQSRE